MMGMNLGYNNPEPRRACDVTGSTTVTRVLVAVVLLVAGCATDQLGQPSAAEDTGWIKIGVTTREEVIARYGDPDATARSPQGEVTVYRAARPSTPSVTPSIPVVRPGPFGTATTEMTPIEPGLGTKPAGASGAAARPGRTIWVRYDTRGVVQEWSFESLSLMPEPTP